MIEEHLTLSLAMLLNHYTELVTALALGLNHRPASSQIAKNVPAGWKIIV